jgi:negative regulator of flagellin synthesis FlgM
MTIDRIGSIDQVQSGKSPVRDRRVNSSVEGDSVSISKEAAEKAEFLRLFEIVSAAPAPAARQDRIEELRGKIHDPAYLNDTVLGGAADDILSIFGF